MRYYPKKSLGQNFLTNENIISLITNCAKVNKTTTVIELGPGKGSLTEKILEKKPKKLIVIEKDQRLLNILNDKFGSDIKIINDDMLKISYDKYLVEDLIIFGNLPYNISTQILVKLIKIENLSKFCKKLVLMFQKEVADRILASSNTNSYGRLSILSNWRMGIKKVTDIEPECFYPKPKVKSTLLIFEPKKNYFKLKNPKNLEHITNIFFSQRRKMIKKPMKFIFKNFDEISKKLDIDLKSRPQNLDKLTYYKICEIYESLIQ